MTFENKVKSKITHLLNGWNIDNFNIHIGYDCVTIELNDDTEIFTIMINEFGDAFSTDNGWVEVTTDGHLVIGFDISNFIISEFGAFSEYDKQMGVC